MDNAEVSHCSTNYTSMSVKGGSVIKTKKYFVINNYYYLNLCTIAQLQSMQAVYSWVGQMSHPPLLPVRLPCPTWKEPLQVSLHIKSRRHSCHPEQDTKEDKPLTSSFSKTAPITGSCWPRSWFSRAAPGIGCDIRKCKWLWCQGNEDSQAVAHPATPSTPSYDRVFPLLTVTPGPQASCLTS